jgi:tetratricopeptide (TPR) repeat protein
MLKFNLTKAKQSAVTCFVLAALTLILYWPTFHYGFIDYDDADYIIANPHVNSGLSWSNIVWAFENTHAANWHPLTWISHMLDCQLFGLNAGAHHLMNVAFHIANTLLLFLWLNQLTGALWRSAFVAALFAWHPLHVESVAWASERKDVLSTFFWLLTLTVYSRYAKKTNLSAYFLALLFFTCGLMSKPMVVTLPFVLLLIDFWPLNRFATKSIGALFFEKLPFFALSIAGSVVIFFAQKDALWSSANLSLSFRTANALMSYLRYISKSFWPTDLALIYPYPHYWPLNFVILAALLLVVWSCFFIWRAKLNPYLPVGWFWFVGTLIPVIGIVQAGVQSMADRYMYIPSIGLFVLVVWSVNDLLVLTPSKQKITTLLGAAVLGACLICTSLQIKYWANSVKLFAHTIAVTTDNYDAYNCLGQSLEKLGHQDEAYNLYAESVRIEPDFPLGQFNLGMILLEQGRPYDAFPHLKIAAQLMPNDPDVQFDFGLFLSQHGNPGEAMNYFSAALKRHPDFPAALNQLAWILSTSPNFKLRDGKKAVELAERASELTQNKRPDVLTTLAAAYAEIGQFEKAIIVVQQARSFALAEGQKEIAAKDDLLLKNFQASQPFHDSM